MAVKEMFDGVAVYAERSCSLHFPDGSQTRVYMDMDWELMLDCGRPDRVGLDGEILERDESAATQWARRVVDDDGATEQDRALLAFCKQRLREEWQ